MGVPEYPEVTHLFVSNEVQAQVRELGFFLLLEFNLDLFCSVGVTQGLNPVFRKPRLDTVGKDGILVNGLKKTASKSHQSPHLLNGFPHIPFDEFPLKKSEDLVVLLEKNMPEGAKVEVTPMADSHHSPCMEEMIAIMVHDIEEGKDSSEIYTIYQFCPTCHIGVRVL